MESSVNQDLKVEADQIQPGTEIARTGENTWKMPKGYEYVNMSFSRKIRALLIHRPGGPKHRYRPTPPNYRPPSQAYCFTSPLSSRKSRPYKPTSLSDRPTSPENNPTSLISIPTPPSYRPIPPYILTSEEFPHIPRTFRSFTTEPGYCPGSLDYAHALTPNKFTEPCDIPTSHSDTPLSSSVSGMGPSSTQKRKMS